MSDHDRPEPAIMMGRNHQPEVMDCFPVFLAAVVTLEATVPS